MQSFILTFYAPIKNNLIRCQLIINNGKISVDNFRSQKIHLPVDATPWNFYCSKGTHPAMCMSNFIKINRSEVGFLSICPPKTKKIIIFEKNIFGGLNFITASYWWNSYFQKHQILGLVFCLRLMFFIFSFFHFPYEFKI